MKADETRKLIIAVNASIVTLIIFLSYYLVGRVSFFVIIMLCLLAIAISLFNVFSLVEIRCKKGGGIWHSFLAFIFVFVALGLVFQTVSGFKVLNKKIIRQTVVKIKSIF